MEIVVKQDLDPSQLDALGVFEWPVWEKEISRFDWTGTVTVTPAGGEPVTA